MTNSCISLQNIWKTYRRGAEEIHALADVSLDITKGDFVAIVGPSGSGKSTLMNLLGCVDVPTRGVVRVGDVDPATLPDAALARMRQSYVGFVFQQFFLIPTLTAEENVLMPTLFSKKKQDAQRLLEMVGLGHRSGHKPSELSGGEMQRVAIARALVNSPSLLLADEPTGSLDSERAEEIFRLFQSISKQGTTVILVTHNNELAEAARRVIRIKDGKIVDSGANK